MVVRRRATIIGTLAILLTATTAANSPLYSRVVSSVSNFQRNFGDLKKADTMSPVERFVFSLVLTGSKAPKAATNTVEVATGRT
jgi:hypothetical protein